ncbi:hypothetical protein IP92_05754 [Pseudoduganella flava]|uniref:Uncharacterized protein n=1 Tax=Pseudoduganella flava TaxID=871742 RepID=A0A562P9A2_9BURK|nr:hypothetical protein [Pseudoduganella flava]QGZ42713.1 hypothetical protein GO485_29220 [Pseudoduganella flava]TWI41034.1 hypothetical protein IP92_05754 [Pseudoduganella flava]
MALENGQYINDLNPANPAGGDPKSQGDDHLRLLKQCIKDSMPGFTGAVIVGGVATGTANTYVLSPATPLLSYTANTLVAWKPSTTNTGVSTINISGLGARNILQADGTALRPGDLSQYVLMVDTGTEYRLVGVTKNYVDQLAFSAALPGQPGGNAPYELISQNMVPTWQLRGPLFRSARTSNTQLTNADQGQFIDFTSGTFTQTFALPSALGNGWNVTLRNSGSGDIELEAPAAVSTTSGTVASPLSTTVFSVPAGLSITAGDLLVLRRTSQPFLIRTIGTAVSYTSNTAQTIATLTSVGTTATLTTSAPHGRSTGDTITVSGATPAAYNGTFVVTVTSTTALTYTMLSAPGTSASPVGSYVAGSTLTLSAVYRLDDSGVSPQTVSTINAGGTTATLTTASAHGLATGNYVTVSGATPAAYNGTFAITVLSPTSFSYTTLTAPGGSATVVGSYTIQYTDWTITTRPATGGIDGKAAYLMYPGETRVMQCDGASLNSFVVNGFIKDWTASTAAIPKPPGYRRFSGWLWAAGASGAKTGSTGTAAFGSGGGACLPFTLAAASVPEAGPLIVGSGGVGPSAAAPGVQGGNSTYAGMTIYGGAGGANGGGTGGSGGGMLSAGTTGVGATGFAPGGRPKQVASGSGFGGAGYGVDGDFGGGDGGSSGATSSNSAYGGGGGNQGIGGSSVYGGAGGGSSGGTTGGVGAPGGTSVFGGNGGAGANAGVSGGNGTAPGGAGGSTQTGAKAGDGARGQLTMKGEL